MGASEEGVDEESGMVGGSMSACEVELERWRKALLSLTPSGSEFVDDPEYCVQFVRQSQRAMFSALRKKRGEIDLLVTENKRLRDGLRGT